MKTYATMREIREANRAIGHLFFSHGALRFFHSRVYPYVYGGRYFITGETRSLALSRLYFVRECVDGKIRIVGVLQGFRFLEDARDKAKALAKAPGETSSR